MEKISLIVVRRRHVRHRPGARPILPGSLPRVLLERAHRGAIGKDRALPEHDQPEDLIGDGDGNSLTDAFRERPSDEHPAGAASAESWE